MAYKLIAIDLDGTLLNENNQIPQRVKHAIHKAMAKGAYVVLSTGRTRKGAIRFYEELGLDTLLIISGGAEVFEPVSGHMVFSRPVDPVLVKELLHYAYDNGIHAQVYIDGELVYRERNKYSDAYEVPYGFSGIVIEDILTRDFITPKVLFVTEPENVARIQKETAKLFPMLKSMNSYPSYVEFASPEISKGEALKFVAEHYHISREEIIAIGDTQIDISMIDYAGLGVAVANAVPEALSAADIVCRSNEDGGVADVIEQYILGGKA